MFDEFGFPGSADLDDAAPPLYTFVYCSRAAEGVEDAEVGRVVEAAQRRNLAKRLCQNGRVMVDDRVWI